MDTHKQTDVVITCTGHADDPDIQEKIQTLLRKVSQATGADERTCKLKSVEPWNSVKVSFDLPREAAIRLQELARSGDDALINLGVLSVQIANGEPLDLNAIRELLQQPPPPQMPSQMPPQIPPQMPPQMPSQMPPRLPSQMPPQAPKVSSKPNVSMPYQQVRPPTQQRLPGMTKPLQSPSRLPTANQKQIPKRSQNVPPQVLPPRPQSSASLLSHPPATPSISLGGLHTQLPPSGMKSPPYMTGTAPTSSIGNIPIGIPSLHLGHPNKPLNPSHSVNLGSSNSFSSVYSIAASVSGIPNAPIQTPTMQSLPNLPTPQSASVGNFPWTLGAKPPQFMPTGQPSAVPQWNPSMFPGAPNLPTNLPGSIPSIGPLPSPSRMPVQRPPKPKKKKVKRQRKPPKDKIPPIPLPPPLMPPEPKPPSSTEGIPPQKPLGMSLPAGLNPISPNEGSVLPNQGLSSLSHPQHPRFPFTQAQVSQAGRSDVSMTSPLLVNLLQSDIASTQFPVTPGEGVKTAGNTHSPAQRMPSQLGITSHHPGRTIPPPIGNRFHQVPQNQQQQVYPHTMRGQPQHPQPSQPHLRQDSGRRSNESFQQQQQLFMPPMPYPSLAPGSVPGSLNRFQLPQSDLPPDHLQFMMQQVSSQAGLIENRMPMPQSQSTWSSAPPLMNTAPVMATTPSVTTNPSMITTPSMADSDVAGKHSLTTATPMNVLEEAGMAKTSVPTPLLQSDQLPEIPQSQELPKSSFDEESALAGMTEAERETLGAAAKIAQDSKPGAIEVGGDILDQPVELPGQEGNFQIKPQPHEGMSTQSMFAVENLAISHQKSGKKTKKYDQSGNKDHSSGRSHHSRVLQHQIPYITPGGEKLSQVPMEQSLPRLPMEKMQSESIDLNSLQSSHVSPSMAQRITPPTIPFTSKAMSQTGQTNVLQNPFLAMPSVPSSLGQNPLSHMTGAPSIPSLPQGWSGSNLPSKGDAHQLGSMNKQRGTSLDSQGKPAPLQPPKATTANPYEWPFTSISPPTQNLSSEGLQFMAKLAAVPDEAQFKAQQEAYYSLPDGSKLAKDDKPHLKALLNEISPSLEGQGTSPRATKRLSSEEKGERKRRKSSPRPSVDQMPGLYPPHRRIDHPGGSIELPRVPTAEELSFSVQQARAHSLDLLKSGSGYPPMPKSAPSSPRGKSRTKSIESIPQYGLQQSDLYRSKHGTLSPVNPMPGGFKTSASSSKSGKSKESKSRSKSPKSSSGKSHKLDASGFRTQSPVTTASNVQKFAGVHEFHPPPGLNIRGPTNPLPYYQSRKTPPQAIETRSPMSPQSVSQFGPKHPQQQNPQPQMPADRKSPRGSRPSSPFASASAQLSYFALSAGNKGPEIPSTTASDSPIHSPGYITSPPLPKISTPTLPSPLGTPDEGFMDDFPPGPAKIRSSSMTPFPAPVLETNQGQMPMGRTMSASDVGFQSGQGMRQGHLQAMPQRFPPVQQPGVPTLWRPQTSKHVGDQEMQAHVSLSDSGMYSNQNFSTKQRPSSSSDSQQSIGNPRSDVSMAPKSMAADSGKGHGLNIGMSAPHPAPTSKPLAFAPSVSYTEHSEVFKTKAGSQTNLLSKTAGQESTTVLTSGNLTSTVGPRDIAAELHGSPESIALSSASIEPNMISTSGPGNRGQAVTRVTRVIPIPQESSIPSFPQAAAQRVPQHSSQSRPSMSALHSHYSTPFSVSSLVSGPSASQGGRNLEETGPVISQLNTSAYNTVLSRSNRPLQTPAMHRVLENPSLTRPTSSAPPVSGQVSSSSFEWMKGSRSHVALEGPRFPLQKPETQKHDSIFVGLPTSEEINQSISNVTGSNLLSPPGIGSSGVAVEPETTSSSSFRGREETYRQSGNAAAVSSTERDISAADFLDDGVRGSKNSDGNISDTQELPSFTATENVQKSGKDIDPDRLPQKAGLASEQTDTHPSTVIAQHPAPPTQLPVKEQSAKTDMQLRSDGGGVIQSAEQKTGSQNTELALPTAIQPPQEGDSSGSGNLEMDGVKGDEVGGDTKDEDFSMSHSDTMKFRPLEETPKDDHKAEAGLTTGEEVEQGSVSRPAEENPNQETFPSGEDGEGSQEDDEDASTSRKRSMRASGRDMYYGPIPTYKRRKPNQK